MPHRLIIFIAAILACFVLSTGVAFGKAEGKKWNAPVEHDKGTPKPGNGTPKPGKCPPKKH